LETNSPFLYGVTLPISASITLRVDSLTSPKKFLIASPRCLYISAKSLLAAVRA
jgi:hypothetical protein